MQKNRQGRLTRHEHAPANPRRGGAARLAHGAQNKRKKPSHAQEKNGTSHSTQRKAHRAAQKRRLTTRQKQHGSITRCKRRHAVKATAVRRARPPRTDTFVPTPRYAPRPPRLQRPQHALAGGRRRPSGASSRAPAMQAVPPLARALTLRGLHRHARAGRRPLPPAATTVPPSRHGARHAQKGRGRPASDSPPPLLAQTTARTWASSLQRSRMSAPSAVTPTSTAPPLDTCVRPTLPQSPPVTRRTNVLIT